MIRDLRRLGNIEASAPRVSGDDPTLSRYCLTQTKCSPRERG